MRFSKSWAGCVLTLVGLHSAHAGPMPDTADPIHNLVELSQRSHMRPFDLTQETNGEYGSERVIFKDTATGATVWKFSHNPGYNNHSYCNRPTWSRDGKWLVLHSKRDDRKGDWLVKADGSSWRYLEDGFNDWSKTKPHSIIYVNGKSIFERDVESGEPRLIWNMMDDDGGLCCPSDDGKKLLHIAGRASSTAPTSVAWLIDVDGKEPAQSFDLQGVTHQVWFTRSADYAFTFDYELRSDTFKDGQYLCEPAKGGAIRMLDPKHFPHPGFSPDGRYISTFRQHDLLLFDIPKGQFVPIMSVERWYHTSWDTNPDALTTRVANTINVVWPFEKKIEFVCVPQSHLKFGTFLTEGHPQASPDGTKIGYDSSMLGDGDFYSAIAKLPDSPGNVQRNGKTLTWTAPAHHLETAGYGVYLDGKALNRNPISTLQFDLPSDSGVAEVTAIEQDGIESPRTKSVAPTAPTGATLQATDPFVTRLSWKPSPEADVAYYNVYSSAGDQTDDSAREVKVDQKNLIASPSAPRDIDWGLQAGKTYSYVITAVNRAGDESAPSSTITVKTPAIEAVHVDKDVNQTIGKEPATVSFDVPKDSKYAVWLQFEPINAKLATNLAVKFDDAGYHWRPFWDVVCPGEGDTIKKVNLAPIPFWDTIFTSKGVEKIHALQAGTHTITLSSENGSAKLLKISVTNDLGFTPKGISSFLLGPDATAMVPADAIDGNKNGKSP